MWTKILIFMVVFFLVANPETFKIVRGLLGGWVASTEGLATPAGLVLHAAVFVGLAIFLPKALMSASGYEDEAEDYEDEEEFEDEDGEGFIIKKMRGKKGLCPPGQYFNQANKACATVPTCAADQYMTPWSPTGCKPRCRSGRMYDATKPRGRRCIAPPPPPPPPPPPSAPSNVVVAPGAAPPPVAASPVATVTPTPVVTVPVATTSPYQEEYRRGRRCWRDGLRVSCYEDEPEEFMLGYSPY